MVPAYLPLLGFPFLGVLGAGPVGSSFVRRLVTCLAGCFARLTRRLCCFGGFLLTRGRQLIVRLALGFRRVGRRFCAIVLGTLVLLKSDPLSSLSRNFTLLY